MIRSNHIFRPVRPYDGLILQVQKRGKQRILSVFTRQEGLLRLFVSERSRGRSGSGAFMPLGEITFDAAEQGDVLSLREYECRGNEAMMNLTWNHYVYSQIFVEMVLHLTPYRQADGGVYGLLLRYSRLLAAKDPRVLTIIAGWQLAGLAGFYPDVDTVRVFSSPYGQDGYYFGDEGLADMQEEKLTPEIRQLWKRLLQYRWEREETLRFSAKGLAALERLLYSYVEQCSEKKLQSLVLLARS